MKIDYERYKRFCNTVTDELGNKLPTSLSLSDQVQLIKALEQIT